MPVEIESDVTIIHSDGSYSGKRPLTMGRDLGNGGYD